MYCRSTSTLCNSTINIYNTQVLIKLIKTIPSQIVSNLKYFEFQETLSATKQKETNEERGKIATQTHTTSTPKQEQNHLI